MKIVIDIPKTRYEWIKKHTSVTDYHTTEMLYKGVRNGTTLPAEHGRLIDADRLKTHFVGTEQGTDLEVYLEPTIINAPTIIPEDKDAEND